MLTITIAIMLMMPQQPHAFIRRSPTVAYRLQSEAGLRPMATARTSLDLLEDDKTLELYEKIADILSANPIWFRTVFDGTLYAPTPYNILCSIFLEISEEIGGLAGKHFTDFGAGDLRASLLAVNLFGMRATAIEKDPIISAKARKVFEAARQEGLTGGLCLLDNTDAFSVSWKDTDVVFLFYPKPPPLLPGDEFRKSLQKKINELKEGAVLAILFVGAQIEFELDLFTDMPPTKNMPLLISNGNGELYLQFYRPPNRLRNLKQLRSGPTYVNYDALSTIQTAA